MFAQTGGRKKTGERFFAGSGIAADASLAGLHAEDAELAEFDALAAAKSGFEGFKNSFDGLFSFGAADVGLCHHRVHNVELDHTALPCYSWARC